MKNMIVIAHLILLIVCVLPITGCSETPDTPTDPFVTTWSLGQEGRAFSISGYSAGHAACKPSEFQLTLNNRSGNYTWRGRCCILLIRQEEIVKEIIHEDFYIPAGQVMQKRLAVMFPVKLVKDSNGDYSLGRRQ